MVSTYPSEKYERVCQLGWWHSQLFLESHNPFHGSKPPSRSSLILSSSHHHPIIISSLISLRSYITSTNQFVIIQTIGNSTRLIQHGSLNVPIEHHPTIRYMVYNGYYKVMSNIPKMGQLPTPVQSFQPCSLLRTIPQETQRDDVHLGDGSAKAHETVHQPGCNKWGISEMI